ncbi:unnamed protein product [Bubo scandiacus]
MWEVMLCTPWALRRVLNQLVSVLQDRQLRRVFSSAVEDGCIYPLAVLAHINTGAEFFDALYNVQRFLRRPSRVMLPLILRVLVMLSEAPETARKLQVLLPDLRDALWDDNADNKRKALVLFRNVLAVMNKHKASPIALQLSDELLHLFDNESSQVRELSIGLFKDVITLVPRASWRQLKKNTQKSLIPLFFHLSDQVESVAKASRDTLLTCAQFLGWRKLICLAETRQTHLIGEYLVAHNRSRVDKYLCQSLPYLEDTQATLREAAIRFIGLAARHLRNASKKKLWEICDALQPLERDAELSVSSLAAQTILILTSIEQKPRSRWSLQSLCWWPC